LDVPITKSELKIPVEDDEFIEQELPVNSE